MPVGAPPSPQDREHLRQQVVLQHMLMKTLRRQPRLIPLLVAVLVLAQWLLPTLARGAPVNPQLPVILAFGHLDQAIRAGQWWRLFSSWLPHHGAFHLLGNVLFMLVLGRPVEAAWGPARTWLICCSAGLAGSLLALNAQTPLMVGASGVVMGLCGATIALGVRLWPLLSPPMRMALVYVPGTFLLMRLTFDGLFGEVEHLNPYAHQGGALAGFAMAMWLHPNLPVIVGERLPRLWTRLAVAVTSFVFAVALGHAFGHLRRPVRLPSVLTREVVVAGQKLVLPAGVRRGLLTHDACVGEATNLDWALEHKRILCFPLEPFGMLYLGHRDTLQANAHDLAILRAADQTGRFLQNQPEQMLYPLGADLMWVLEAPEPALRWHASALIPLLPPPGAGLVRSPPLEGRWLLPWQVALVLMDAGPLPHALDLGDGVQLLLGNAQALQDPHGRDEVPLAVAGRSRQFVRILPGAMLLPLPLNQLAVLLGPDSRLDDFAARLLPILPPAFAPPAPPLSAWLAWAAMPFQQPRALPVPASPTSE
jgi:membrane associated rhomboid family serine protease